MVYCCRRLYITHTLTGFLFDFDQSNISRIMQKIEPLVRKCVPIPQKMHRLSTRLRTPEEVERYFPGFISFTDCTEQLYQDLRTKPEGRCTVLKEEKAYRKVSSHGHQPGCHLSQIKPQERKKA